MLNIFNSWNSKEDKSSSFLDYKSQREREDKGSGVGPLSSGRILQGGYSDLCQ